MIRTKLPILLLSGVCMALISCNYFLNDNKVIETKNDSLIIKEPSPEEILQDTTFFDPVTVSRGANKRTDTGKHVLPEQLLRYAKTLLGTPYKYASIDPHEGLDCSGFITHVFSHFSIQVPRSSVDFTNYGTTISTAEAEPGDLILFTGTDSLSATVGHMGIVTGVTEGVPEFIHSTSGKAYGVTITTLNAHYRKRFVKLIRIPYTATKLI